MKYLPALIILILVAGSCKRGQAPVRTVQNINRDWKFVLKDLPGAFDRDFDDSDWRTLDLPHDFSVEGKRGKNNPSSTAGGFYPGGIGWYRKYFEISQVMQDKKIFLKFDGVFMNPEVWVNGNRCGLRINGYISHYYDITGFVKAGVENVISVRVDNSELPVDRWYTGSGIYRNVRLICTGNVHIPVWGVSVTTPEIRNDYALARFETEVANSSGKPVNCIMQVSIAGPGGKQIALTEPVPGSIPAGQDVILAGECRISGHTLWSTENPQLYTAEIRILSGDKLLDKRHETFGIRKAEFDPDLGFLLNGDKLVMKGVCIHHDGGCVGSAAPEGVWQRRLEILKDMGCNALRLAHNPHAPEILDMADRLGFVVIDEMYDKWVLHWQNWQEDSDTNRIFLNNWRTDLNDFIERDRNHPSVVLWSVGNETIEQLKDPDAGVKLLDKLVDFVHEKDPTRPVTCAMHPTRKGGEREDPSRMIHHTDVVSYNYCTDRFREWKQDNPGMIFLSSETKAYREGRPEDFADVDFIHNSWFQLPEFAAGQFIWSGIDYLGESWGWPCKGFMFGLINTCGFRKSYSYFTESVYSEDPMVHIAVLDDSIASYLENLDTWQILWAGPPVASYWNFPGKKGQELEVFTFSNCETVELELNGHSLGEKRRKSYPDGVIKWKVPYDQGTLIAIGKNDDREICRHELSTAGTPEKIELLTDKDELNSEKMDVAHVEVRLLDDRGRLCRRANNLLQFSVEGKGRLLGADNGDLSDQTPYQEPSREARNGRCLLVIGSEGEKGLIRVNAEGEGLRSDGIEITVN